MSPAAARIVRPILVGFGATLIVSALVNLYAARKLLEPADEALLGLTPGELTRSLAGLGLLGLALIFLGLRWTRPRAVPRGNESGAGGK